MRDAIVAILLGVAGALALLSAIGVLATRDPYDRLHFTAPCAFAGVPLAIAVAVDLRVDIATEKAALLAIVLLVTSPVAVHVIARATRVHERGSVDVDDRDPA
jgi:monovalent cation/proton antiporter MnhG/PhaG subunit